MTHETAGDPVSGLKWTRRMTAKLADELRGLGIHVCPQTVARLLKAMGYSLRVNHKKLAGASNPNRDRQFRHITDLRDRCAADNSPSSASTPRRRRSSSARSAIQVGADPQSGGGACGAQDLHHRTHMMKNGNHFCVGLYRETPTNMPSGRAHASRPSALTTPWRIASRSSFWTLGATNTRLPAGLTNTQSNRSRETVQQHGLLRPGFFGSPARKAPSAGSA